MGVGGLVVVLEADVVKEEGCRGLGGPLFFSLIRLGVKEDGGGC